MYRRRQGRRSAFVALLSACWLMLLFGLNGVRTFSLQLLALTICVLLVHRLATARRRRSRKGAIYRTL
jgi:4-amino-4-deoxy-L-arabinose transferase-like glycosyltransferase